MRHLFFYFGVFCLLMNTTCNNPQKSQIIKDVDLELICQQNIKDSVLATGWYYILENENGFRRQLDKSESFYYLDPKPILVKEQFETIKIHKTNVKGQYKDFEYIYIKVFKKYNKLWAEATEKAIYKQLGLIIDNKLVQAPTVNDRIESGVSALKRGVYSREELDDFLRMMQ